MSQKASLLELPPELRLLIYEHLPGPTGRIYINPKKRGTQIQTFDHTDGGYGLLFVCRQIRNEYLPDYIETAVRSASQVVVPVKNFNFKTVHRFLAAHGGKRQPEQHVGPGVPAPYVVASLAFCPHFRETWRSHPNTNLERWFDSGLEGYAGYVNYVGYELRSEGQRSMKWVNQYINNLLSMKRWSYYGGWDPIDTLISAYFHQHTREELEADDPDANPFETSDSEESEADTVERRKSAVEKGAEVITKRRKAAERRDRTAYRRRRRDELYERYGRRPTRGSEEHIALHTGLAKLRVTKRRRRKEW
ncbi:hypothetical protein NU195Hw_g2598t1 [Hortaea werneckii]